MAKCIMSVVSPFEVYDHGNEIGVLNRESAYNYTRYPIAFQGSIEATYSLARSTCEVLRAFCNANRKFPKYLDQFIEGLSGCELTREEYLTELRLFLQHGLPENCGQCRFFLGDKPCKYQLPRATPDPVDEGCVCGIRKEHDNAL